MTATFGRLELWRAGDDMTVTRRRLTGGWWWLTLLPVILVAVAVMPGHTHRQLRPEDRLVEEVNVLRAARKLPPLHVDIRLAAQAEAWSEHMAAERVLSRATSDPGELVATGGTVESQVQTFAGEARYRAVLVDPARSRIGVGVDYDRDGVLFTTVLLDDGAR